MDRTNRRPTRQKLTSGDIQGLAKDVLNVARGNLNPETSSRIETASSWLERYCLSNKFDASTAVNTLRRADCKQMQSLITASPKLHEITVKNGPMTRSALPAYPWDAPTCNWS